MTPITWRNIEAPSFRDAILAGAQAQQTINSGFDSFNKLIDQESKTNIANWDNTKNNNTQEFLNQLNQYRTPEELQAAQASGVLDALRQRFGAQIDQAAVRTAEDKRVGELTDRVLKANAYADDTELRTQRPIEQSFYQKLYSGDTAGAANVLKDNPNLRNMPAMAKLFDDYSAAKTTREREGVLFAHQQALMPLELADKRAGINLKNAQAASAGKTGGGSGSITGIAGILGKIYENDVAGNKEAISDSMFSGESANSTKGMTSIGKTLDGTGVSVWNMLTNSGNFVDNLIAEGSSGKDPLISADGKNLLLSGAKGEALQVPLTAAVLERAIRNNNGAITDPSIGGVLGQLREFTKHPTFLSDVEKYVTAKNEKKKQSDGYAQSLAFLLSRGLKE